MSSYTLDRIASHFGLRRSWFRREDFEAALLDSDPPMEMARAGVDLIVQSAAVGRPTTQLISALVELSKGARDEADRLSIEALGQLKGISVAADGGPNAD